MPKASHLAPRPVRVDGDVAYVTLTLGYVSIIDAADAERVGKYNWAATVQPGGVRATRKMIFAEKPKGQRLTRYVMTPLHRFIMEAPSGMLVDHINGDPLDNRRSNLRLCTHQQNMWNRKAHAGRDLPTGVTHTKAGTFLARIRVGGRAIYIGCFKTAADAGTARRRAEAEHFGEFAPNGR